MSSSDGRGGPTGAEPRLVRTAGLGPPGAEGTGAEEGGTDDTAARAAVERLRERTEELEAALERRETALAAREARIEELTDRLESVRRERDDARAWASFLDDELREHRARVETLESRVEALDSRGLLDRLRGLFG